MTRDGTDATPDGCRLPGLVELTRPRPLDRLLARSNFVVLTVPHNPATRGDDGTAPDYGAMEARAFFLNIAPPQRGTDHAALDAQPE